MLIYMYDFVFWKLKSKHEIIDNNDEKHGRMIGTNRWNLCKLWCTFSFAGNLVLKIRVDSSAQHIWGVPSNELLTRGSHRNDDNYNFCICVTFLLIIRFILIFISAIRSHLSFHPPVQRNSVTDTLLPFTTWLQWFQYPNAPSQQKTRFLIPYILLK